MTSSSRTVDESGMMPAAGSGNGVEKRGSGESKTELVEAATLVEAAGSGVDSF